MRIAIISTPLHSGHTNRGIGRYTKHLINALQLYQPHHTYICIDVQTPIPKDIDILHYPFFDPFYLTLPMYRSAPTIVTVHDLIPLRFPEHFPRGIRGKLKWEIQRYTLRHTQRIITDSQTSKNDIQHIVSIPGSRIDVIPLAPTIELPAKERDTKDKEYRWKRIENYFLYVGDVNWNKNILGLLHAFAQFKKESQKKNKSGSIVLVLVGKAFLDEGLRETKEINEVCKHLSIENDVIKTGYVAEYELVGLYQSAIAYIQPSLYEGFGFPVLDAFVCGCPVICSKTSSLGEIAGPALLVDPLDTQSIARAMNAMVVMDRDVRTRMVQEGYTWINRFSWESVAQQTVRAYEKVLGNI